MSFGERIKDLRKLKGLSQRALGERMGVKQQTIAQFEKAKKIPKIDTLERLSKALDVPIKYLTEDDWSIDIIVYDEKESVETILKHSIDDISMTDLKAFEKYRELNNENKDKAIDYMDLLKLRQDQAPDQPDQEAPELYAAHERTDIEVTDEMRKHDDKLMNDENF